jgi:Rrf2 family protein
MKFSTQEDYGLRCLMQLAQEGPGRSLTVSEIGRREGLSETHVAKLAMMLRKAGYIKSTRGQAGGYMLARPAEQLLVRDVLATLGGRLYDDSFCTRHSGRLGLCTHNFDCRVRGLWQSIQSAVDEALGDLSIADLLSARLDAPWPESPALITLSERPTAGAAGPRR